ncbi:MAG: 3-hydroxyacyl-CoA dehydrogenase family protein [Phormidesmis sp. FL-bin-119]|nr:3-hydroxyacyl-CoA dehydrogenase family protein [Pedobacter sp.]
MDFSKTNPGDIQVGVVGIGLMGSSIIVSLLTSGHVVKAIAPIPADMVGAKQRIVSHLNACSKTGLMKENPIECIKRLELTEDYSCLKNCKLVLECVIENIDIKEKVYSKITLVVSDDAVIATNTSAIAITVLQKLVSNPERFIGIHWAEPAFATRFMEITCGDKTEGMYAEWVFNLAHHWGKEPTLLKKDIMGFITNRLMYAVYREIFHLVESGRINLEDADKAFRYDVGSWITLMGLFRRMDYTGLADYAEIFKNLFPQLSNSQVVPDLMQQVVETRALGIQTLQGLYQYSGSEAREWENAFAAFNEEIFRLASKYPDPIPIKEKILV